MPGMRAPTRLQDQMVALFAVLVLSVVLVSFYLIRYAIETTAQNTMREELNVGARVFSRLRNMNSEQLIEATSVLTYDFGFREAIATRDRPTIVSALRNHSARIKASGMMVIGMDGIVVADTISEQTAEKPFEYMDLIRRASREGRSSDIRVVDGIPYQIIVVPVLAPLPIAWVTISFVINDRAVNDLRTLTLSDVTFLQVSGKEPKLLATTLPLLRREEFLAAIPSMIAKPRSESFSQRIGDEDFEVLVERVDDSGQQPIYAVLQRSTAEGLLAYQGLQVALLFIAGISLTVTLLGALRIAQRITRPVMRLGDAAQEIERGNYAVRVDAGGTDEIGRLGRAFNRMAQGLAERDNMRDVLGKVASVEVVSQLLEKRIELGGEERDATVMFTDIRNFTALAESLAPEKSLQMLNEFLTVISEVVEGHGGVVDKYLGDGVMAIFGAPVTRPDDAQRAVACALEIRNRLEALGPMLAARGLPHPQVGVGVNSSRVIAGNIGSPTRLNYTVLGDGVNLASRLEGLTKRYLVPIVVGESTCAQVTGIEFRELDKVRVRGRSAPSRIFEPLGVEGSLPAGDLQRLNKWREALTLYRSRRWDEATALLEMLASERGYERVATLYLGYLRDLRLNPPGEGWDAAFTLYDK
jgi:adenylate cyclase